MKKELLFAADCLEGTKDLVEQELLKLGEGLEIFETNRADSVIFKAVEDYQKLKSLRKISSLYYLLCFPVKGPGNLLKANYLSDINLHIQKALKNSFDYPAKTFRINAPGEESQTYRDIISKIEHFTGLNYDKDNGDLLIRFRKHPTATAWEVLIRLSSRPLSVPSWRTNNFKGALNPILAAVLYDLAKVKKGDEVINLMCGSGTIIIEAAQRHKAARLVAIDNDEAVLEICNEHIKNAHIKNIEVFNMDARQLNFPDNSFDIAFADFPWGENIGNKQDNSELYQQSLSEIFRILKKNGKAAVLTQDIQHLETALKELNCPLLERRKVYQGGFHPEIFILQKQ